MQKSRQTEAAYSLAGSVGQQSTSQRCGQKGQKWGRWWQLQGGGLVSLAVGSWVLLWARESCCGLVSLAVGSWALLWARQSWACSVRISLGPLIPIRRGCLLSWLGRKLEFPVGDQNLSPPTIWRLRSQMKVKKRSFSYAQMHLKLHDTVK